MIHSNYSNLDEKITSNEVNVTSNEQIVWHRMLSKHAADVQNIFYICEKVPS